MRKWAHAWKNASLKNNRINKWSCAGHWMPPMTWDVITDYLFEHVPERARRQVQHDCTMLPPPC